MNLNEAIEILQDLSHPAEFTVSTDIKNALTLGIEALKRLKRARVERRFDRLGLLLGETKE